MYYYKVYGLNVESEIQVSELTSMNKEDKKIDLNIFYGTMPDEIKKSIDCGRKFKYEIDKVWFYIKDVATFYICNGKNIMIEPDNVTDPQLVKVYILGSVLGIAMIQKDIVAIHGGVIEIEGNGYIFTGDKGAGKSTLTTALRKKGYGFVSDDVGAIKTGEINKVYPGFGYQKLCEDAMVKLGYETSEYSYFRSDFNIKYIVPALENFVSSEIPLEAIFELEEGDIDTVQIEEVKGNDKLQRIIKNIFRIEVIMYGPGMNKKYFKKCIEIAKGIRYYKVLRPKNKFTVDEQIDTIIDVICNDNEFNRMKLS